ncbi:MAG: class I SAM-dependent methyltransferase [Candidatus Accumulibacter sp.]|nr:class I SAM-dependent methyltransferase [Accumulibacter sp.]
MLDRPNGVYFRLCGPNWPRMASKQYSNMRLSSVSSMNRSSTKPFACPVHKTAFADGLFCPLCGKEYPSVNDIPVLINDENSVFRTADYLNRQAYGGASSYAGSLDERTGLRQFYRRLMYRIGESSSKREFRVDDASEAILAALPNAEILVIGSGDTLVRGNVTYTDVAFGKNVQCIADAHDLPFVDGSFDACIAVAVLEHVADPYRCVQEIMRVLRPGGYVYSEIPFMQPVHMGAYDFTRFTHLGHRRLFRHFDEIRSGVAGGPGTSAGQLLRYALVSLSDKPGMKRWLKSFGLLATYPFRWLDYLSRSNLGAYDSASGFYFFGKLARQPLSDRELLGLFRGG